MIAFAELIARHPTKPLALLAICDSGESGGYPIQEIFLRELIRLRMSPQIHAPKLLLSKSALTYTDELINELYALSDIGVTSAEGEGFGLCQFEAMGVGIPQVVPDVGGFKDFCLNNVNSKVVPITHRFYLALSQSSVGGLSETVDPFTLSLAIEDYILDTEMREEHGRKARETVLQYNWKNEVGVLADVLVSL
jgi:glycosyltransferase involved in cell wall biosynthesis